MLSIHKNIEKQLDTFIDNNKIPNIIFHGESGCGKKTILKNFLNKIYKDVEKQKEFVMYVNCAFGKGIKFIRDELKFFAKTNIHSHKKYIKSIVLLDCELLTTDAQSALRRCIELFSKNTRFFIVVNDKEKLLKPIISRFCSVFIPLPRINNEIINLHHYNKDMLHNTQLKKYNTKIKNCLKYNGDKNIMTRSLELYEKGISYFTIEKYILDNVSDSKEKYIILLMMAKYKKYNKNDKLLICSLIHLYNIRKQLTLENIYTM